MDLPNTWVTLDGQPMARTAAMEDSAWRALIESQGWTPGATGAGTAPGATPQQIMAWIFQAIQSGVQVASTIHGAITAANAPAGTVTLANGMTVPIEYLGLLNISGTSTTPPLTIDTSAPPPVVEEEKFELTPATIGLIGGGLLILLVVLRK
jgi:hypothetical protein